MFEHLKEEDKETLHSDDSKKVMKHICQNFKKEINYIDLGTGSGWLPYNLSKRGFTNVYAADKFPLTYKKNVNFIRHDLNDDELKSGIKFDLVTCLHCVEHLHNPFRVFDNVYNILKDDGLFNMCVPDMTNIFQRIHFLVNA